MAVHPLRPATDRRLGGPLHRQLANRTRAHPGATAEPSFNRKPCGFPFSWGISTAFAVLSPSLGQVAHALLTRLPLGLQKQAFIGLVRLACVKHAASVRPEPGSNSPWYMKCLDWLLKSIKEINLVQQLDFRLVAARHLALP